MRAGRTAPAWTSPQGDILLQRLSCQMAGAVLPDGGGGAGCDRSRAFLCYHFATQLRGTYENKEVHDGAALFVFSLYYV